jgi:hypothetical protein
MDNNGFKSYKALIVGDSRYKIADAKATLRVVEKEYIQFLKREEDCTSSSLAIGWLTVYGKLCDARRKVRYAKAAHRKVLAEFGKMQRNEQRI